MLTDEQVEAKAEFLDKRLDEAEKAIQRILLGLVNDHGIKVIHVNVDTGNFGNCRVEICAMT